MADVDYKRYAESARRGIKGEAFFESLVVDYAIPHRIARQNDLGVDFLCEWIYRDRPTGILFSAQVKTTTSDLVKCKWVEQSRLNGLDTYTLSGAPGVHKRTINYWKGLGLPAFLFIVIEDTSDGKSRLDCYHKRCTPLLTGSANSDDRNATRAFYHANDEQKFRAYADPNNEEYGF